MLDLSASSSLRTAFADESFSEHPTDGFDGQVSDEYCTRMQTGLQHWGWGGNAGNLAWGIFHVRN